MATSSNTARPPKYGLRNDSDGLRIVLPSSAFDKLIPSAYTCLASSSGTKYMPYDVFINHCGQDVKHTLASDFYNHLHRTGLRVFLDKDELKHGDFFPKVLEQAIRSASLHIAIFSEGYARSPWCLAELAVMVETRTPIIPIFCGVEPSDLRWAVGGKGKYADAFSELEKKDRYPSKELQQWKQALQVVSLFHGGIIKNIDDKHRVVKIVVNRVMEELNVVPLEVAKHPVGLDKIVQDFDMTASQSVGPIQIIGIWGMGGSGKTTLAMELYNKKRSTKDKSSFLFNLRDAATKGQLHKKQEKLLEDLGLKDVPFDNVEEGKGILKNRLRSICVFIILDDVDGTDQLDALLPAKQSLGQDSLIIVTTRDRNVLKKWGISTIYQMKPLNTTHAEQLFCWHAFLQPSPQSEFKDLVEKFLNACHGLPLSLKVLGGQLYGQTKDYWQRTLNQFSRISDDDITERLKVSYDALKKREKEMFLDAACFFIGQRKSAAIAAWDAEYDGLLGWETLFNKCFVEVDKYGCIRMHDHLRDLGRNIANGQSPHRLWSPQQIIQVHSQQEAIQIRGMASAIGDNCYLRQGNIIIHTNLGERSLAPCELELKIFVGNGDFINQEHSKISRELVWLQFNEFEHKNLPSWLSLKNLRILELFNPRSLQDLWERDENAPSQLRELAIQGYSNLRGFPASVARLKNLKKILLIGKENADFNTLSGLPQEFCHLQSLEHLEIKWCRNLSLLPSNFGKLTNLQHLNLNGCTKLKVLPLSFKKLTLLEYLNLMDCSELIIKSGLHILENMTKLKYLNLNGCSKLEELCLPEGASLTELYLKGTSLKELPANISQLTKLTKLAVGSKFLTTLPTSLGNLSSLSTLEIQECKKLEFLPDSLGHLNFLIDLIINQSGVKCLPKSLIHLQSLYISNASELSFGSGCVLKRIDLRNTKVSKISINGDCCPFLERLSINFDSCLRELETLPATLKTIIVYLCYDLQDIRGVRGLKKLQKLEIKYCEQLDGLPCLAELVSLEIFNLVGNSKVKKIAGLQELRSLRELRIELDELPSLANLTSLKNFTLGKCNKLEKIESFRHLKLLEELNISDCPELKGLPNLAENTSLKEFRLEKCHKLEKIEGLESLTSLQTLNISDCPELDGLPNLAEFTSLKEFSLGKCHKFEKIEGLESLTSLETLSISDCGELDGLPNLAEIISLKKFRLKKCHKLKKIEGLEGLTSLATLNISDCAELERLPNLAEIISLKEFRLEICHKLEKIEGLESLISLETLNISDCPELDGLPNLAEITSLKEFRLEKCHKLEKIEGLESLISLEKLNISDCPELDGLPNLAEITFLKEFRLEKCHKLEKIEGIESLTSLKILNISDCPELDGLPNLAEIISLKEFRLVKCYKLEKIEGLESLTSLETLNISDCPELDRLPNLPNLAEITSLKDFKLEKCHKLEKIEGLESLTSLKILNINDCPELDRLPNLAEITSLKYFRLEKCHKLEKIEGLESLTSLETLDISDCPELDGLPNLAENTSLKEFRLEKCHKLEKIEGFESLTSLETLNISDCPELNGLPNLAENTSLKGFRLKKCHKLEKIEGLESLTSLETLNISDCPELDGLPNLAELTSLKNFRLEKWHKEKIEGLESLTSLKTLNISDCPEVDGLPNLGELTSLKNFRLEKWHKEKIEGLESLTSLETLNISDCPELNGLPSLAVLTSLKEMDLRMCHKLEKIEGLERLRSFKKLEVHTHRKAPCIVRLEQFERLESLVVVAEDRSVVEAFISKMQKWPSEVIMCARAVFDVGSPKTFFEELPNVSVLDYSDVADDGTFLNLRRPESSANANAILICFIIDWVNPDWSFRILTYLGNSFGAELSEGKWVWMGVFTQPSLWLRSTQERIRAVRKNSGERVEVKVEEAWSVMGEEGSIIDAFRQLLQR